MTTVRSNTTRSKPSKNTKLKQEVHLAALERFYDNQEHFRTLCDYVDGKSGISLRALEFLCHKLAPRKGLTCRGLNGEFVDVHGTYLDFLSSNGKNFFDPVRRNYAGSRIKFTKHGRTLMTTIAQLRFFKFAIENNVVRWAQENKQHMLQLKEADTRARKVTAAGKKRKAESAKPKKKRSTKRRKKGSTKGQGNLSAHASPCPVKLSFGVSA